MPDPEFLAAYARAAEFCAGILDTADFLALSEERRVEIAVAVNALPVAAAANLGLPTTVLDQIQIQIEIEIEGAGSFVQLEARPTPKMHLVAEPVVSQRGRHRWVIRQGDRTRAIAPLKDDWDDAEAAQAAGTAVLMDSWDAAFHSGYVDGHALGLQVGDRRGYARGKGEVTNGRIEQMQRDFTAETGENRRAFDEAMGRQLDDYNGRLSGLRTTHRREIENTRIKARDAGMTSGAIWGLIVGSVVVGGAVFLLGHFGVFARLLG